MKSTAIIGIGNMLMGDEGVGIHIIERLRTLKWPDDIEIIDGQTAGIALLHSIDKRKLVIIIDCADFGGTLGEVRKFDPEELVRDEKKEISLHATDILSVLALAKKTISYPEKVFIIGIQPKTIAPSLSLSAEVASSIDTAIRQLNDILPSRNLCTK